MPPYSLNVKRSRSNHSTTTLYDTNIIILAHYSGQYRDRLERMSKLGVVRAESLRTHISLVLSPGDIDYADEICTSWASHFDVTLLEMSTPLVCPKITGYYLWLRDAGIKARWHIRVDDDSLTDIRATVRELDIQYPDASVHLLTDSSEPETTIPLFTHYLTEMNITPPQIRTEWESSVTSGPGMNQILNDRSAVAFLEQTGAQIAAPSDRSLTFAAYIANVPVKENPLFSKDFQPTRLTLLPSGSLAHIHYVPWHDAMFVDRLEMFLNGVRHKIGTSHIAKLTQRSVIFGRCIHEVIARLVLTENGHIVGANHPNESRWSFCGNTLRFWHSDGRLTTAFNEVIVTGARLTFLGQFLLGEFTHYIECQTS